MPEEKVVFDVGSDYDVRNMIGSGAYGKVAAAVHRPSGQMVAIKKIDKVFDFAMLGLRTLREIKLLRYFKHENIISIFDILQPPADLDLFREVYLIQELMETDLHRIIRTQKLSNDHCQYFIYQTLRGLHALHSANVIHRDLKPSNLLLNGNCDLKICDFGLARHVADVSENQGLMTEYVATRWYRAPEIMLNFKQYAVSIDIWSVGCILAEMLARSPLFPGKDYHDQLKRIFNIIGTPQMDDFAQLTDKAQQYIRQMLPFTKKVSWAKLFERQVRDIDLDFIGKVENWPADHRTNEQQAQLLVSLLNQYDSQSTFEMRKLYQNDFDAFQREVGQRVRDPRQEVRMQATRDDFHWRVQAFNDAHSEVWDQHLKDREEFNQTLLFLDRLLAFNPKKRPTAAEAMADQWVSGYHDPNDEPGADPLPPEFFAFDKDKDSTSSRTFKKLIYQEIKRN